MIICESINLYELEQLMGHTTTVEQAERMRRLLRKDWAGKDTQEVPNEEWNTLLEEACAPQIREVVVTKTHYIDDNGEHVLPTELQRREFRVGDVAITFEQDEELDEPELDDIDYILTNVLGIETEEDEEGNWVVTDIEDR